MTVRGHLRIQFWVETGLAAITGSLLVLTLFWHEWLEALGFDPDHGSGSAEWFVVAVLFMLALASGVAARLEWRRAATASA